MPTHLPRLDYFPFLMAATVLWTASHSLVVATPHPAFAEEQPSPPGVTELLQQVETYTHPAIAPEDTIPTQDASQDADEMSAPVLPASFFTDVRPSDWAFQSLQALDERYGCLEGYFDQTFRGNRALSRYEVAAGINACVERAAGTAEDLLNLRRLLEEFQQELADLQGQLEALQWKTTPFSITTQLQGRAQFAIIDISSGERADGSGEAIDSNTTLSSRVELTLNTSFTGRDLLRARLRGRNIPRSDRATGTDMARLGFEGSDRDSRIQLSTLELRLPLSDRGRLFVIPTGGGLDDVINDLEVTGDAISRFGKRNPLYRLGGDTTIGVQYAPSDDWSVSLGYAADDGEDPRFGVFNAPYGAIAHVAFTPSDAFGISLAYLRAFNSVDTGTGSRRAADPFDDRSDRLTADAYGIDLKLRLASDIFLGGWAGWIWINATDLPNNPQAKVFTYAAALTFFNLGGEGNEGGIVVGQPPKLVSNELVADGKAFEDEETAWHVELYYSFQVADGIEVTPGLLVIFNPEHDRSNDTIYVATLLTTFRF